MVHFDVAFVDCSDADSISAEYYQIEDGWVTFKAGKGFLVASYPAGRIASIKCPDLKSSKEVHVNFSPDDIDKVKWSIVNYKSQGL